MSEEPARLVLASRSAIRRKLLEDAGLALTTDAADLDERALGDAIPDPAARALHLATAKALAVSARHLHAVVLGSDQVGVLDDGTPLEKPADPADHLRMLLAMSGRAHTFHVAAALVRDSVELATVQDRVAVTFRRFDEVAARAYLASGEGAWSCGGYQIEHRGAQLIAHVQGSLHAVLGLPLFGVIEALRAVAPELLW